MSTTYSTRRGKHVAVHLLLRERVDQPLHL
jgi:hypothetical protein